MEECMTGSPPPTATASRVQAVVQLSGTAIAVVQGGILPFLGLPFSVPIFLGAATMAGVVAPAIGLDAKRRRAREEDS